MLQNGYICSIIIIQLVATVEKFKTYILFTVLSLMAIASTSCMNEDPYQDPLWGSWILVDDGYGWVDPNYAEIFYFGSNGYGSLDWYDEWGYNYIDDFSWSANGSRLDIFYYDGSYGGYDFRFRNGNLQLYDGYSWRIYQRYY